MKASKRVSLRKETIDGEYGGKKIKTIERNMHKLIALYVLIL